MPSIQTQLSVNDTVLNILISGDFDFSLQREFREAYINYTDKKPKEIIINLLRSNYLDSSAIGMLLVMSDIFKDNSKMKIINCKENVLELLQLAQIDTIFQVS